MNKVLELLKQRRCDVAAQEIERELGLTHDETYGELIALEAQGRARIVVSRPTSHGMPVRTWEAL